MHLGTEGFVDHAKNALQDAPLQEALHLLTTNFAPRRVEAMAALGNAEDLRTQARAIKAHTIDHLDRYLEQFATQLTQLGVHVHWADDAAEAREIVASIAKGVDAKVVVKGKSMATEEIQLNDHLEAQGYEVVETDLGEYIIQLAGEAPSHIIAPAIHKTRKQIAELLHDKLQTPYTEVIPEMTQIARRTLRQQFLRADVGITGVNFAVAETGSIVIVTNEGNGRLSSTLPKVHVAVMGMEKVIPRLSDLSVMLKVLTNSATGQKISSYVTMMTGPRRGHDLDGPEEQHVVIMDNGRTSILRSANREALYCLRCGACLNVCPIYQNIGGHAYGWVYPGPIGAVLTPLFVGLESAQAPAEGEHFVRRLPGCVSGQDRYSAYAAAVAAGTGGDPGRDPLVGKMALCALGAHHATPSLVWLGHTAGGMGPRATGAGGVGGEVAPAVSRLDAVARF